MTSLTEFKDAHLCVEREVSDVDLTRGLCDGGSQPQNVSVRLDDAVRLGEHVDRRFRLVNTTMTS